MSVSLFFKRFLARPFQVAAVVPSSPFMVARVAGKFDFSEPRVIAEFGPGEGCHTREIVRRMHPGSRLLLFELDPELAVHLKRQFGDDPRVSVLNTDAQNLPEELARHGLKACDYVLSGIPFSILQKDKKRTLVRKVFESLAPESHAAFVIYQVSNELRQHATIFPRVESEYWLANIPPMFITVFYRLALNGVSHANAA
jgi:phosphatidylethanolamine/phosphatidyl-N-methylethanolamine N-methyltransferase